MFSCMLRGSNSKGLNKKKKNKTIPLQYGLCPPGKGCSLCESSPCHPGTGPNLISPPSWTLRPASDATSISHNDMSELKHGTLGRMCAQAGVRTIVRFRYKAAGSSESMPLAAAAKLVILEVKSTMRAFTYT